MGRFKKTPGPTVFPVSAIVALQLILASCTYEIVKPPPEAADLDPIETDFPMKAYERYLELKRAEISERVNSGTMKTEALHDLWKKINESKREIVEETIALNRRIYEARQSELRKAAKPELVHGKRLGFDVISYPRSEGSTSTQPLAVLTACRLIGAEYEWSTKNAGLRYYAETYDINIGDQHGSDKTFFMHDPRFVNYLLSAKTEPHEKERLGKIINQHIAHHSGTHEAYVQIINGKADIGLIARRPSEDEKNLCREKRVYLDVRPVALDAFVFVVQRLNPVRGLSTSQIRRIYTQKYPNWKDFGGPDKHIPAFRREKNSGSEELMLSLIFGGKYPEDYEDRHGVQLMAMTMSGPFNRLLHEEWGLGYSVYYYEHFMAGCPYTRTIAVDGVNPNAETIASGEYPYTTKVYVVIRSDEPDGSPARRLRDWYLSAEGQSVVAESGYVPLGRER